MTTEQARLWVFVLLSLVAMTVAIQVGSALVAGIGFGGALLSASGLLSTKRGSSDE